jgi:hypothetical protein
MTLTTGQTTAKVPWRMLELVGRHPRSACAPPEALQPRPQGFTFFQRPTTPPLVPGREDRARSHAFERERNT